MHTRMRKRKQVGGQLTHAGAGRVGQKRLPRGSERCKGQVEGSQARSVGVGGTVTLERRYDEFSGSEIEDHRADSRLKHNMAGATEDQRE